MRLLFSIVILAMTLAAGCSRDIEKYVAENKTKRIVFVYGNSFFFSSFKPMGWISDRFVTQTNNLSLYLRPTNNTVRLIAYGILLTNKGTNQVALADSDAESVYKAELARRPGLKMEKIAHTAPIDQAAQVIRYRYTAKKFFQESLYIFWNKSAVMLAMQTENPAEIEYGVRKLDIFVSQIKYWGTDSDALSFRVIKTIFKKD